MSYVQTIIDEQDRKNLDLIAERDALRAVLREIVGQYNDNEVGFIDGELIERAEKLLEPKP